jgi:regulator of sirC expression with transglutaminase-like and TPR domain
MGRPKAILRAVEEPQSVPASAAARQALAAMLAGSEDDFDLVRSALLIAQEEYPSLDIEAYAQRVERLAQRLQSRVTGVPPSLAIGRLNSLLFDEERFKGNADDYYDPRNSYLNDVLDRKLGLPITLSILYVEIGRRAGLRLQGVGFPGHFIVAYDPPDDDRLYVDVFGGGGLLSPSDLRAILRQAHGQTVPLTEEHLRPAGNRYVLGRVIGNLKLVYLRRRDYRRALRSSEQLSLVLPTTEELRDRGAIRYQLGDLEGASADLARYLEFAPDAEDADETRRQLRHILDLRVRRN